MKVNFLSKFIAEFIDDIKKIQKLKKEEKKKPKAPPIKRIISYVDDDEIFRGFEAEIEEEWLERGITKNGKWKR